MFGHEIDAVWASSWLYMFTYRKIDFSECLISVARSQLIQRHTVPLVTMNTNPRQSCSASVFNVFAQRLKTVDGVAYMAVYVNAAQVVLM